MEGCAGAARQTDQAGASVRVGVRVGAVVVVSDGAEVADDAEVGDDTPSPQPTVAPTPLVYWSAAKLGEGAHGGLPLLQLPAAIAIDYTASGTCKFTIEVTFGAPDAGVVAASLAMSVTGSDVSGTWPVKLKPGPYYVSPGEAVGCTYSVTVRDPA
jgi:hypothetical protein